MIAPLVALGVLWGAAEATLFVVVPDVLLSYVALRHGARTALWVLFGILAGALLGGMATYALGAADQIEMRLMLDRIPGIPPGMIMQAEALMRGDPLTGMLEGSVTGIPFKVFAGLASSLGVTPTEFPLLALAARTPRFVAVVLAFLLIRWSLGRRLSWQRQAELLAFGWVAFYAVYWSSLTG